ncbi:EamA family transporter [Frigidibacter sp. MR17.24]|uniref:EamA family transporter n=1 Tax=Frigidibacter sp. MR17.24 TaxID=3127345 RepID=UPI003012D8AE
MSGWLTSLDGTVAGHDLALGLALFAALSHALFGALQKGRHDPWIARAGMDMFMTLFAVPCLLLVPFPEPHMWPIFAGAWVIHSGYKLLQAMTYSRGAFTVVYPVVRGTAPLFAVIGAGIVFGEHFAALQWLGIAVLLSGIFGLAVYNLRTATMVDRGTMLPALGLAAVTGASVALYTTYDAYGIRATANPFTFLAWFFFLDGWLMPILMHRRLLTLARADRGPLLKRGAFGALVAYVSFGSIMLATRLDSVGEAAVLRETSTVFAALIGWLVLGERVGPRRFGLMTLIALGAVIVEFGG